MCFMFVLILSSMVFVSMSEVLLYALLKILVVNPGSRKLSSRIVLTGLSHKFSGVKAVG